MQKCGVALAISPCRPLQTSLFMVTISMEAVRRGHAVVQISKTIRCFWHTLY